MYILLGALTGKVMSLIHSYFYSTLSCRVLVGTGRACYETLRPLAYSLLAELIHHVRLDLSLPQVLSEPSASLLQIKSKDLTILYVIDTLTYTNT